MKKINTRTVLVALLMVASLCSYIYLNTVEFSTESASAVQTEEEESEMFSDTPQEMVLPDVQLLRKVIESGKRLLPTSNL